VGIEIASASHRTLKVATVIAPLTRRDVWLDQFVGMLGCDSAELKDNLHPSAEIFPPQQPAVKMKV
jgi:hypothetical protein